MFSEGAHVRVHVTHLPVAKSAQRLADGEFLFEIFADAGTFKVMRSTDLQTWTEAGIITVTTPNFPGTPFTDTNAHGLSTAFYRVR